jgi:hypothetical protein
MESGFGMTEVRADTELKVARWAWNQAMFQEFEEKSVDGTNALGLEIENQKADYRYEHWM